MTRAKGKSRKTKILKTALVMIVAFAVFLILYSVTVIANSPKIDPDNIYSNLSESSILYDDKGNVLENIYQGDGNRINVDYDQIPDDLINAVVSIEDKTFWSHHGFNVIRIFGAIKDSLTSGGEVSGTSTITQQLARNVYLPESKSIRSLNRKVAEAWYAVLLERTLTKEQIMEAYLNTIYFGYNSYGIQAASQAYYSKDVEDLNATQCIALAAIPKSPNDYALVKTIDNNTIESEALELKKKDILYKSPNYTIVYNGDAAKGRRLLAVQNMQDQGYLTAEQADAIKGTSLKKQLDLDDNAYSSKASYFTDFAIDEIISDLTETGYSKDAAKKMVYTGGLKIYTSLSSKVQGAIDEAFKENSNFPSVANLKYDSSGNIINDKKNILLYKYSNMINDDGQFILSSDEYTTDPSGDIILKSGNRLNFYDTVSDGKKDYSIEMKDMYMMKEGTLYSIESSTLLIPQKYKSKNSDGDIVIDKTFIADHPDFFVKYGDSFIIDEDSYNLGQEVKQPQGSMVIIDYKTGEIKGLSGGRETTGKLLYDRADSTRQPGSSIKPLSVYSTALQEGEDAAKAGTGMKFTEYDKNQNTSLYGSYWTAASKINDAPLTINGKVWPKNWYNGYRGIMTLRKSVEQSVNVNAVRVFQQIGPSASIDQLKKFGITSLVETGTANDKNAAALALGGMAKGISPIEMASAYGTFPNGGQHVDYTSYTKITDKDGNVILDNANKKTKVMSEGVSFIMTDILRTTVTNGVAKDAKTQQPTAGKTGTTTDNYDAWFCGFTPQYSAACWLGNDINIELDQGSSAAAKMWSKIMTAATAGETGSFSSKPSSVIRWGGEYYIDGTQKAASSASDEKASTTQQVSVETCSSSGYIATPWCKDRTEKIMDSGDEHALYYCPVHNQDPDKYPIPPGYTVTITQ
ncbi:MAG: transglycosylase domain-containing protein [Eubacteriaceae bacterium]|nr:transglycosylase domain-containing protein [Eubacteriaceae bacterium]